MPRLANLTGTPQARPQIGIYSYKAAAGITGQFEFDVSALRDPAGQKQFAGQNGTYKDVIEWMKADPRIDIILKNCFFLADDLVKPKGEGAKAITSYISFAFKDFHGKWIAPAVAEIIGDALGDAGYNVVVHHGGLKTP